MKLDDRLVPKDVLKRIDSYSDRIKLLETECSARDLKALIGRANLLVAEQMYSLVGSVGMRTQFMCLGVRRDTRVCMIVGSTCKAEKISMV